MKKKDRKRVLLHGYTALNLGDDLFFRVIADRYPDTQFVLPTLSTVYRKRFSDVGNLKIVDFCQIAKVTSRKIYILPKLYSKLFMKRFDAVVCIGGSLFIDRQNPSQNDRIEAENYSFICDWKIAEEKKVPYYILGANWGPCYNDYFFQYFNRAFDAVKDLYFRDTDSYELFRNKPQVRYGCDILLGSDFVKKSVGIVAKKKQIAFSVIEPSRKMPNSTFSDTYIKKMASLADEFAAQGYDILFLSFCRAEGDKKAIEQTVGQMHRKSSAKTLAYNGNYREILVSLAESELTVASRFHGTVLSYTLGTPAYSVYYSGKTEALLKDLHIEQSGCYVEQCEALIADIVLRNAALPPNAEQLQTGAFEQTDALLR